MTMHRTTTTLNACRSLSDDFVETIVQIADATHVSARALTLRSLMQLPRIADENGRITGEALQAEIQVVAVRLAKDVRLYKKVAKWPMGEEEKVSNLVFGELPSTLAEPIFSRLHYLRSYRPDSRAYALFHPATHYPLAICLVSPLQWKNLAEMIFRKTGIEQNAVLDVSRVFVFDEAPKNSISKLLAKVREHLSLTDTKVQLLSTAVDQNLGFTGNSYRAANWQLFCKVRPRPYLYVDEEYKTIRQIQELFGEKKWDDIASTHDMFEVTKVPLLESLIFVKSINNVLVEFGKTELLHREGL